MNEALITFVTEMRNEDHSYDGTVPEFLTEVHSFKIEFKDQEGFELMTAFAEDRLNAKITKLHGHAPGAVQH